MTQKKLIYYKPNYTSVYLHELVKDLRHKGKASRNIKDLISQKRRRIEPTIKDLIKQNLKLEIKNSILNLYLSEKTDKEAIRFFIEKYGDTDVIAETLIELFDSETKENHLLILQSIANEVSISNFKILFKEAIYSGNKALLKTVSSSYKDENIKLMFSHIIKQSKMHLFSASDEVFHVLQTFFDEVFPFLENGSFSKFISKCNKLVTSTVFSEEKAEQYSSLLVDAVAKRRDQVGSDRKLLVIENGFSNKNQMLTYIKNNLVHLDIEDFINTLNSILVAYNDDKDIIFTIKKVVLSKIKDDHCYFDSLVSHLNETIDSEEFSLIMSIDGSVETPTGYSKKRTFNLLLSVLGDRSILKYPELAQKSVRLSDSLLKHDYINNFPKILVDAIKLRALLDKDDALDAIVGYLDHPSNSVRGTIISIYANPSREITDKLISFMLKNINFLTHRGISEILGSDGKKTESIDTLYGKKETESLHSENAIKKIYHFLDTNDSKMKIKCWRAINILSNLKDKIEEYQPQMEVDMYNWSDNFLAELAAPSMKEVDVVNLVRAFSANFDKFKLLSIVRQVRHRGENDERNVYVLSFLRNDPKQDSENHEIVTYFAKQYLGWMAEKEVEGTELLKVFGEKDLPTVSIVEHGGSKYFIREFMDGFDLNRMQAINDLIDIQSPIELLKKLSYQLGKIAVQTDLLAKGDYGGGNELVNVQVINGRPEIKIKQIDLSSSFALSNSYSFLGDNYSLYRYYLDVAIKTSVDNNVTNVDLKKIIASFYEGISEQYSMIHSRFMRLNESSYDSMMKTYINITAKRIEKAGPDILPLIIKGILKLEDFEYQELCLDVFKGNFSQLEVIQSVAISDKTEVEHKETLDIFNSYFAKTDSFNEKDYLFKLREFIWDLDSSLNLRLLWGNDKVESTTVTDFLGSLSSKGYDKDNLNSLIEYLKNNLDSIIFACSEHGESIDLIKLLDEL